MYRYCCFKPPRTRVRRASGLVLTRNALLMTESLADDTFRWVPIAGCKGVYHY
jgi:hypothetical protein